MNKKHLIISHLLPYHTMQLRFLHLHRHFLGSPVSSCTKSCISGRAPRNLRGKTPNTIGFPWILVTILLIFLCELLAKSPNMGLGFEVTTQWFYGKTVRTCQKRRLLKGNHLLPTIHFQFFEFLVSGRVTALLPFEIQMSTLGKNRWSSRSIWVIHRRNFRSSEIPGALTRLARSGMWNKHEINEILWTVTHEYSITIMIVLHNY